MKRVPYIGLLAILLIGLLLTSGCAGVRWVTNPPVGNPDAPARHHFNLKRPYLAICHNGLINPVAWPDRKTPPYYEYIVPESWDKVIVSGFPEYYDQEDLVCQDIIFRYKNHEKVTSENRDGQYRISIPNDRNGGNVMVVAVVRSVRYHHDGQGHAWRDKAVAREDTLILNLVMSGSGYTRFFRPETPGLMRRVGKSQQYLAMERGETVTIYPPSGAWDEYQIFEVIVPYQYQERVEEIWYQIGDSHPQEAIHDRKNGHYYLAVPREGQIAHGTKPLWVSIHSILEFIDPKTGSFRRDAQPPVDLRYQLSWVRRDGG